MLLSTMLVATFLSAPQDLSVQREGRVPVDPSRTTQLYEVRDLLEPRLAMSDAGDAVGELDELGELGYVDAGTAEERRRLEERIRRYLKDQAGRRGAPGNLPTLDTTFRRERLLRAETQDLAAFAAKFVDPPLRGVGGKLDVAAPGTLTLTGSPEQHAWLQGFLERHRQAAGMVDVSARFLRAPAGTLASLGISPTAIAETADERAELEAKLADTRFEKAIAPRLRQFLLSRAEIRVQDEVSYIEDWEFTTVEPGHQRIADPRIGRVSEGHSLVARVALLEPGLYAVSAEVEKSDVVRPIRTATVVDPETGREELEIALPEVRRARIVSDLKLRDGASAVLIHRIDAEHELVIVIGVAASPGEIPLEAPAAPDARSRR